MMNPTDPSPLGGGVVAPDGLDAPPAVAMPQVEQPQAAPASECDTSMMGFQTRRQAQLEQINNLVKAGKGKMDPVAACPKFRGLVAIESELKAWVLKNKDWCSIPDQFVDSLKVSFAKTPEYARKACAAAAMVKRGGPMGQAGPIQSQPAMKLPTGPL